MARNKLAVVIKTSALNAEELAEYCRRKGLYPEQIQHWDEAAPCWYPPKKAQAIWGDDGND